MKGSFKKAIAVLCAIAMVVTSVTVYNNTAKADDYSGLTWTQVGTTNYYVASANDDFPFQALNDQGTRMEIIPLVGAGTKPIWPAFSDETLNGTSGSYAIGAGIFINYADLTMNAYNVYEATSAVDSHRFQIIIKAGTPVEGETTTVNPDAPTTTPAPTTTTELQKPSAPEGLVANINDLKTNYTIAWAAVSGATSYKFYVDGTYIKDIGNGGVVTIEELGLKAGQKYTFGVSAVNDAGESAPTTISVTVPAAEETTTPSESEGQEESTTVAEAFDPSTITEWTAVTNSTTLSYYIADGADAKVSVKPEMHGDNLYAAFALAAKFSSVTLNGEAITPRDGADIEIAKTSFVEGYNKLVVVDYYGKESVTIYVKAEKEEETTTKAYVDGEVLVNDSGVKEVPAYEGGDYWQMEFNNAPVTYVAGKKYVAEVVVSSTAAKTIKLVFQRVNIWDFVDAAAGYETTIGAGNKVKITYVFEATQSTDNGNFDIYLGSVADATTLDFESKKLTTYNVVPEGVVTGVEVLSAPEETTEAPEETTEATTEYGITVDGVEVTKVEAGNTYTLPTDATYGYYCDGKMYKAGATVTVNADMAFTSVNELSVSVEQGAGIRVDGTAGIRFQAKATTDNEAALASDAITEGMLITANDLYQNFGDLTTDCDYTKLAVTNSGWYNDQVGTYCGSIVGIVESNYIRKFIARAYLTITYEDGTSTTVYSGMTGARSIAGVAQAVAAAGYPGLTAEQQALVNVYAAAK